MREDAEFHSFQMLEAAIRQHGERTDAGQQRILMVAAARYLAAKAPTQRELLQTLQIAQRLHRGEAVLRGGLIQTGDGPMISQRARRVDSLKTASERVPVRIKCTSTNCTR